MSLQLTIICDVLSLDVKHFYERKLKMRSARLDSLALQRLVVQDNETKRPVRSIVAFLSVKQD